MALPACPPDSPVFRILSINATCDCSYVGGRWYTFDPTEETLRGGRLAVAYGRDAADVAVYHQFGPPAIYSSMDVRVKLLDGPPG